MTDDQVRDDIQPGASIRFRSDMTVELVKHSAADSDVLWAARVSTAGEQSLAELEKDPERSKGLINYLMRDRHGSPFEHNSMTFFIAAPIFVFREFMRHRVGWCVTGDTEITTASPTRHGQPGVRQMKIADLYQRWHGDGQDSLARLGRPPAGQQHRVRVLNEETMLFEQAPIVDVVSSGVKEVLTLRAATGQLLKCTRDHAVFTNEGWVKAGDLDRSHLLVVSGRRGPQQPSIPRTLRQGIAQWTATQRMNLIKPVDSCYVCGEIRDREELTLDHVVPVTADLAKALDTANLLPICPPCWRRKAGDQHRLASLVTEGGVFVPYERVGDLQQEATFDLSVSGPWHNFLANDIVVHNSYNEESGRYRELQPVFYVPGTDRKLVQRGRPGKYTFVEGTPQQLQTTSQAMREAYQQSYDAYQKMLAEGVAREVARSVLPVGLYSSMYATCNARSLMHFLSLRTKHEDAAVPSFPQREIEMVGERMEEEWAALMPLTYAAYNANGRIGP